MQTIKNNVLFRLQFMYSTMAKSFSEMNATGSEECDGLVVSECIYHYIKAIGHNAGLQPKHKSHSCPL